VKENLALNEIDGLIAVMSGGELDWKLKGAGAGVECVNVSAGVC